MLSGVYWSSGSLWLALGSGEAGWRVLGGLTEPWALGRWAHGGSLGAVTASSTPLAASGVPLPRGASCPGHCQAAQDPFRTAQVPLQPSAGWACQQSQPACRWTPPICQGLAGLLGRLQ